MSDQTPPFEPPAGDSAQDPAPPSSPPPPSWDAAPPPPSWDAPPPSWDAAPPPPAAPSAWDAPPSWDAPPPAGQPIGAVSPPAGQPAWGDPPAPQAWAGPAPAYGAPNPYTPAVPAGYAPKSKMAAGLLGIFLGAFGVHNFYLGNTGKGVAQLLISVLSCGLLSIISAVWGIVEGVMILTGSITTDAKGVPLAD